jgi:hypothetical protein
MPALLHIQHDRSDRWSLDRGIAGIRRTLPHCCSSRPQKEPVFRDLVWPQPRRKICFQNLGLLTNTPGVPPCVWTMGLW